MYIENKIAMISTNSHTRAELAVMPSCSGVNLAKERKKFFFFFEERKKKKKLESVTVDEQKKVLNR